MPALCNEMILWFSEGRYVMKALDLKNRMGQLTGEEKKNTKASLFRSSNLSIRQQRESRKKIRTKKKILQRKTLLLLKASALMKEM